MKFTTFSYTSWDETNCTPTATYLRSTISECSYRLNNVTLLHCHKDIAYGIDVTNIAKPFVSVNSRRQNYFGSFNSNIAKPFVSVNSWTQKYLGTFVYFPKCGGRGGDVTVY